VEQQFLINAIRFEASHIKSAEIKRNVLVQLNRVSNDIAVRVAEALGLDAPAPDPTYYHNNVTAGLSIFNHTLPTIKTLRVGVLASTKSDASLQQAKQVKERLAKDGVMATVVAETLADGVDQTYSAADATAYDGVVVADGAEGLFGEGAKESPLFPAGRPGQVLLDAYRWGKPVGGLGKGQKALKSAGVPDKGEGVYTGKAVEEFVKGFEGGLARFKVCHLLSFSVGLKVLTSFDSLLIGSRLMVEFKGRCKGERCYQVMVLLAEENGDNYTPRFQPRIHKHTQATLIRALLTSVFPLHKHCTTYLHCRRLVSRGWPHDGPPGQACD